jgi:hypothetical protein
VEHVQPENHFGAVCGGFANVHGPLLEMRRFKTTWPERFSPKFQLLFAGSVLPMCHDKVHASLDDYQLYHDWPSEGMTLFYGCLSLQEREENPGL